MDENETIMNGESKLELKKKKFSDKTIILILSIALIIAVCIGFYLTFKTNDTDCDKKLTAKDVEFNKTLVGAVNYVQDVVTTGIVNQIYNSTQNCNIINVQTKENFTRQLVDVECVKK